MPQERVRAGRAACMDHYDLAASGERDGLWDWDLATNRVHFSPRWASMLGYEDGDIGNSPEEWLRRVHAEDQSRVRGEIEAQVAGTASGFDIRHRMHHSDGTCRWMVCRAAIVRDDRGLPLRLVGSHADVTADHLADPMTGLPNRELFADRVARSIERARRNPDFLYAVLLIELDRAVPGETAWQAANDPLPTAAARRLETCLRGAEPSPFPGDDYLVARLHGSQFAVLLDGLSWIGESHAAAERVLAGLLAPLQLRGRQVFPRASIGIAVSATGYTHTNDVLRDATAALSRARSLGGNRCEVFDTDLVHAAEVRLALEADLEQALQQDQFLLLYQPVVEAASSRIVGLEALARWQHPTRGMIPPQEFIPIAEKTGFIVSLESWTLREACRQLKAWQETLPVPRDLWVSVNLSGVHFRQPGIVERVGNALRDAGVDPSCLVLEMTESVVMEDPAAVKTLLMQLRVMGVRIGIDDFGTGHSSFAYLHQFPADFLKVDQSFVRGMEVRQDKADIVGSVAGLAGQLGLRVIAEGIESEAGLQLIRSRGCEYLQGFLLSRPVDVSAAAGLLRNGLPVPGSLRSDEDGPSPGPEARTDLPATRAREESSRHGMYVLAGVAILALLASPGLVGRFTGKPAAPPPPSKLRALDVAPVIAVPASPAASAGAGGLPTSATPPKPAPPKTTPRAPQRAAVTLEVDHQHVFGSCRGVLRVAAPGVSFNAEDAKDVFAFEYGRFQSALGTDSLTIKDARRTYRFTAAQGAGKGASQPPLARAFNAINDLQPK